MCGEGGGGLGGGGGGIVLRGTLWSFCCLFFTLCYLGHISLRPFFIENIRGFVFFHPLLLRTYFPKTLSFSRTSEYLLPWLISQTPKVSAEMLFKCRTLNGAPE